MISIRRPWLLLALAAASAAWAVPGAAQDKPAFGISFSGFVKTDILYDSRQTVSLREGHFLLYPKPVVPDPEGRDLNAASSFHILSLQTRLQGKITGPDALGAKTSGLIEAEFFGTSEADINGFRLRHAFLKLEWKATELLVGQYWHPLFVVESFPDVVSFNTGAPFQPFNRSPQIRLTRSFGRWSLQAAALSQRDFSSAGPDGGGTSYARNAAFPELVLKLQRAWKTRAGGELLIGAAGDYKRLRPRLQTASGYMDEARLGDWSGMAFFKARSKGLTLKLEAFYGQNPYHLTMLGGYAVQSVLDAERGLVDYAAMEVLSGWADVATNGRKIQAGLFLGWSRNLGVLGTIGGPVYGRGFDIKDLYRVAPRIVLNAGPVRLAGEVEYTSAAYGPTDAGGRVSGDSRVANLRLLAAVYYFF